MNIKEKCASLKNNKLAYIGLLLAVIVLLLTFNSLSTGYKAFSIGIDNTGFPYKIVHDNGDVEYFESLEEYAAAKDADTKNEVENMHKGILASPLDNLRGFIKGLFQKLGGFIVDGMVDNFDPTFSSWYKLEHGTSISAPNPGLDKASPQEVITMTETEFEAYMPSAAMIFRAAKVVGIALSSILVIINLFLCLFGQANTIRTTVVKTMGMWAVSLISIFLSYKLVVASMKIMYAVWDIITSYGAQNINWYCFSACENMVNPNLIVEASAAVFSFFFGWFVLLFVVIMLIKPLKGFFKLYCQLIEYYVAYIIILLMFPAVVATIVSPSTINIFKAYCRMVIMEMLLFTFSGVFMKVFAILLINGTLFTSIPNYIACLCVIKVAQNLQLYASAIGINSVQATGSFIQACGTGFMGLITGFNMLSRSGANLGNMMKNTGVALNKEGMFKLGSALQNPMQATMQTMKVGHAGSYQDTLHNNFTNAMKQRGSGIPSSGMVQYGNVESALQGVMPESYVGTLQSVFGSEGYKDSIYDVKCYSDGHVVATGAVGNLEKHPESVLINPDGSWEIGKGLQTTSDKAVLSETNGIGYQTGWHNNNSYGSIPKEGGGLECPEMIEGIKYGKGVFCSMTDNEVRDHIISEDEYLVKTFDATSGNNYYTAAYPETMNTPEIAARAREMGFTDMGVNSENGFFTHNYMKVEHNKRANDDSERDDGSDANKSNRRTSSRERSTAQKTGGNKA